jgi:hypothetical protein
MSLKSTAAAARFTIRVGPPLTIDSVRLGKLQQLRGVYHPMEAGISGSRAAIGFLTVLEHPQHGLFGGYLLLNLAGRPLEFHCTAPVKPNRAQQILYGPTLEAFLYGEQIGHTLLEQAKAEPLLVCTDREPVLAVRDLVSLPVALVFPPEGSAQPPSASAVETLPGGPIDSVEFSTFRPSSGQRLLRVDAAHPAGPRLLAFQLGRNRLAVPERSADDRRRIAERLGELAPSFDLAEPFTRIREAIEEAQQAAR